jgi:hypothetical protein
MRSNLRDISVVFVHQTEKAVLVAADEEAAPVWIPKSRCEMERPGGQDPLPHSVVTLTAPEATLVEKGLL